MPVKSKKFILFSVLGEKYAMPLAKGTKFIEFESLSAVPDVDPKVAGIIYHEGRIVTILDTAKILEVQDGYQDRFDALIFDFEDELFGILVEEGIDTAKATRTFTDSKKKKLKKYIKIKKEKIYILEPAELLKLAQIL